MTIILYDTPGYSAESPDTVTTWSPFAWKARLCLNFKGIPYRTEWVEFADIQSHFKKLGIQPTRKVGEEDLYTVPAIFNTATGEYVSDTWRIAEYLEKQHPDTPTLFPNDTKGLQAAFTAAHIQTVPTLVPYMVSQTPARLSQRSAEYFIKSRETEFKLKKFEEFMPTGEKVDQDWKKIEESFEMLDKWFRETDEKGPFMLGNKISWADVNMVSFLKWMKFVLGEGSKEWGWIKSWNGGRWGNLLKEFDQYSTIVV
ncbi:hypothetical protein CPC08DRAFT_754347 [Agrocybe pediades]|nr:hypothetical protein CPC08DRAFT_754347 [Agrocybe pediades]